MKQEQKLLTEEQILLRAAYQLLKQQDGSFYVHNVLNLTTVWDDAHCDGYSLMSEIEQLLDEGNVDKDYVAEVEDDE